MNFGIIFACLLVGCIVGFEFGKAIMASRIRELLNKTLMYLNHLATEHRTEEKKEDIKQYQEEKAK